MLGVIDALRERIRVRLFPPVREIIAALAKAASNELGEVTQVAREAGQVIGRGDAITTALRQCPDRVFAPAAAPGAGPQLTRREQKVADLNARDLTDKQLARRLVIAKRTADTHVHRILVKLGCANRANVAVIVASGQSEPVGQFTMNQPSVTSLLRVLPRLTVNAPLATSGTAERTTAPGTSFCAVTSTMLPAVSATPAWVADMLPALTVSVPLREKTAGPSTLSAVFPVASTPMPSVLKP